MTCFPSSTSGYLADFENRHTVLTEYKILEFLTKAEFMKTPETSTKLDEKLMVALSRLFSQSSTRIFSLG